MKEIIDKLDFVKIKNFCSVKDTGKCVRTQAIDLEKISVKRKSDRGLLSKYAKNS